MPPRRANSPRPATSRTGAYPRSRRSWSRASWWRRAPTRSSRGVAGRSSGARVCWRRAWTLATRTLARPVRHAARVGDAGCRLVGDQLAPFVGQGGPRFQRRDERGIAEPRPELIADPVADLGVAGDPHQPFVDREGRGEEGLGAVGHVDEPGVATDASDVGGHAEPVAQRAERPGRGEERRQRGEIRQSVAGGAPLRWSRLGLGSAGSIVRLANVGDLGIDGRRVEVGAILDGAGGVTRGEIGRDLLGDPALTAAAPAQRRLRHRRACPAASAASPSSSGAHHRRRAVHRPRPGQPGDPCRPVAARTC